MMTAANTAAFILANVAAAGNPANARASAAEAGAIRTLNTSA